MTIQERQFQKSSSGTRLKASSGDRRGATGPSKGQPTHEEIAARAKAIWQSKGCPAGQDEENWHEAEVELRGTSPGGL